MPRPRLVVAAAFAAMFTVFGVAYSFGAFFEPMAREFGSNRGATAAVFAITAFLYFSLGAVSGAVADRVGASKVLLVGAFFMGPGLLLTAAAPAIWVGYLTYGVGVGVGTACGYVPMVAAVAAGYGEGRALAIGVAVTGIGLGTLVVAPLAAVLIGHVGWRETYVLFGVASFVVLVACALLVPRPPAAAAGANRVRLGAAVRSREFALLYVCGLLTSFALFMAFVHLVPFAQSRGAEPVAAAALIGVIGAASAAGRLGLGALAGRLGSLRAFQLAVAILAFSFLVWLVAPAFWALVAFALLLGFGYGGWVALSPSLMADLFGTEGLGGSVGALYTSAGVGALLGPPVAGALVDRTGTYVPAIACGALLALAGAACVANLPSRGRVQSSVGPPIRR